MVQDVWYFGTRLSFTHHIIYGITLKFCAAVCDWASLTKLQLKVKIHIKRVVTIKVIKLLKIYKYHKLPTKYVHFHMHIFIGHMRWTMIVVGGRQKLDATAFWTWAWILDISGFLSVLNKKILNQLQHVAFSETFLSFSYMQHFRQSHCILLWCWFRILDIVCKFLFFFPQFS